MRPTKLSLYVYRRVMRLRVKVHFKRLHWMWIGEQTGHDVFIDLKCVIHPAKIFLHECLHLLYGDSEDYVKKLEDKVWRRLSRKQIEALYRKMLGAK